MAECHPLFTILTFRQISLRIRHHPAIIYNSSFVAAAWRSLIYRQLPIRMKGAQKKGWAKSCWPPPTPA
jgi:hypothetical protein